ncbi:MAG: nicotinate-nucleotide adenylyltransferase [Acidimicrobiales bacterium]
MVPQRGRPERLGVLGGTFDPPHNGHLFAARRSIEQLALDRVLLVVANDPWQKSPSRAINPASTRLAMTEAAVAHQHKVHASPIELDRGGPSYTVDTVEELMSTDAPVAPEVFLIVGADVVDALGTWHRPQDLARLVTLVVVSRPGVASPWVAQGWRARLLLGEGLTVSSSQIRDMVGSGLPIGGLVPKAVAQHIERARLYARPTP